MKKIYLVLLVIGLFSCKKEISLNCTPCIFKGEVQGRCYYIKSTKDIPIEDNVLNQDICVTMIKKINPDEFMVITDDRCEYSEEETIELIKERILFSYQ